MEKKSLLKNNLKKIHDANLAAFFLNVQFTFTVPESFFRFGTKKTSSSSRHCLGYRHRRRLAHVKSITRLINKIYRQILILCNASLVHWTGGVGTDIFRDVSTFLHIARLPFNKSGLNQSRKREIHNTVQFLIPKRCRSFSLTNYSKSSLKRS